MSLATRCPACGTVFRVVRDQLKVSDGWVRCGRCSEVFDASKALFDLDSAGLPVRTSGGSPWPPAGAPIAAAANDEPPPRASARVVSAMPPLSTVTHVPPTDAPATDATAKDLGRVEAAMPEPAAAALPGPVPAAPAAVVPGAAEPPATTAPATVATAPAADRAAVVDEAPAPAANEPLPGFMLRAQRAERRRRPGVVAALAVLALGLGFALAGQMAWHYRDLLAASAPASRPYLEGACALLGCRIEAPRRIDSLSVESSALLRIEDSTRYRLQVVVRNRAPTVVRMPAVDLTLTDSLGQTTARRVLEARELGVTGAQLPPQGEVALVATLDLGDRRVAGYTVELFYP